MRAVKNYLDTAVARMELTPTAWRRDERRGRRDSVSPRAEDADED